jgi:hypothetical protein
MKLNMTGMNTGPSSSVVSSGATTRNTVRLSSSVSWEADLWGRIGRNIEAGEASAQASAADLAATVARAIEDDRREVCPACAGDVYKCADTPSRHCDMLSRQ